jgi:NRPS condensation-like uncharacterized protein
MNRAVKLSFRAEPIINCCYIEGYFRPRWELTPISENKEYCRLLETHEVEKAIFSFLFQPIDPFSSPQVQALIIRDQRDVLCINMNHMVGDTSGLKDYLYLLSSTYGNLVMDHNYQATPNFKGSRSLWQVSQYLTLSEKIKVVRVSLSRETITPDWRLALCEAERNDKFIITRALSPTKLRLIQEYAKQHQVMIS